MANSFEQTLRRCTAQKDFLLLLAELPQAVSPGAVKNLLAAPQALYKLEEGQVASSTKVYREERRVVVIMRKRTGVPLPGGGTLVLC